MKNCKKVFISVLLLTFLCYKTNAQSFTAKGKILDETELPVPGASVFVKGNKQGVISDMDGVFSITVPDSLSMLEISFIGYETQTIQAGTQMVVKLKLDALLVDEVVVTGMQKMDKRLFTGASTKLTAESVKLDGLADISRGLEGKAAGVSVQNVSGTFGTAPKIRVRGATSILGSSKPLWVVDGVIMEDAVEVSADQLSSGDAVTLISSSIAGLNANDIESFQILKDGSATSIYGARAMAGVIVITTKRGAVGTSQFSYTGELTTRLVPTYRDFNIMNSQQQMDVYNDMYTKGWLNYAETSRNSNSGIYGKMYQLIDTYNQSQGRFGLMNTEQGKRAYLREAEMRNTDWFTELFSLAPMQNHSVSMSAGTEKLSFYASLSAMYDPGWYVQSNVNRYTANLNMTYNILKNLSLNLISNGSYRNQKAPGTLTQDTDAVSGRVKRDFDINPYSYALNSSRTLDPNEFYTSNYAPFNLRHELANNYIDLNIADLKFQGDLRWKVIPSLELSALGAIRYQGTAQEHHIKDNSNQAQAYRAGLDDRTIMDLNRLLYRDPDNPTALPISILPKGGIYKRNDYRLLGYDFRTTFNWNKTFNDTHITNLFGGMEINASNRSQSEFEGWGMQYSDGEMPFHMYEYLKQRVENGSKYYSLGNTRSRSVAFFGNATYSYRGKYTINGTMRYEGTNRMGKSRSARWMPTWNVSGAWNMHEENFFKAIQPILSNLTLKTSYSLTADRGPDFVTNSQIIIENYTPYRPFTGIQEPGLKVTQLENSELTYEKKHELNIGVDFGLIANRINISMDWYKRNNFDLIGVTNTAGVGGQIQKYANVASMKSQGFELSISTRNIATKDFKWTTDFVFSYSQNEITDLFESANVMNLISGSGFARQGYPVRSLFSIPFMGLDKRGIPTILNEKGEITSTDINFQERQRTDFLKYEGPTDPPITGSLGNIFSWKGFRLNIFLTYSFGNVVRLNPVFKASYSDLTAMTREFKNRWSLPGDEEFTNIPAILDKRAYGEDSKLSYGYNSYNYSTERIAKGDFIRLKEISVAYDFPKSLLAPIKLSSLSLKIQATNLLLLYADKKLNGQDPEFFNSGGVAAPIPRQFTLTLRIGL